MFDMFGKPCFSLTNIYKLAKHEFGSTDLSHRYNPWSGKIDFPVMENFWAQRLVKKIMLIASRDRAGDDQSLFISWKKRYH